MSDREHAKLSASGAKRWMACPRSVALEEEEEEKESPFALEGTHAHSVAEVLLRNAIGDLDNAEAADRVLELNPTPDMRYYVDKYVEGCIESYHSAKLEDPEAFAMVEERVAFTDWVPGGFGTCDFSVISVRKRRLTIRDMKYGKGVAVSAEDNPQPRLYALGMIQEYGWIYDIDEVEMHIDQPRLHSFTTEILSTKELLEWAEKEVKPKALIAYSDKGSFKPGEHCKFCRVRATCKARANKMLDIIQSIIGGDLNGKD